MDALLGAIKGAWRGVILILLVVLFPGIAWLVATHADGVMGLSFTTIFLVVLALEVFLGFAALFGIASELQERHSEAMDRIAPEQSPE
jgi:bacteriorhodopsin